MQRHLTASCTGNEVSALVLKARRTNLGAQVRARLEVIADFTTFSAYIPQFFQFAAIQTHITLLLQIDRDSNGTVTLVSCVSPLGQ